MYDCKIVNRALEREDSMTVSKLKGSARRNRNRFFVADSCSRTYERIVLNSRVCAWFQTTGDQDGGEYGKRGKTKVLAVSGHGRASALDLDYDDIKQVSPRRKYRPCLCCSAVSNGAPVSSTMSSTRVSLKVGMIPHPAPISRFASIRDHCVAECAAGSFGICGTTMNPSSAVPYALKLPRSRWSAAKAHKAAST